jgi:hypothetical protein
MYWLIEDLNKIDVFCKIKHKEAYIEVIPTSNTLHPVENQVCAVYIRPLQDSKGYIIAANHSETLNIAIEKIQEVISSIEKIYVRDKKEFLHYFIHKHAIHPTPTPRPYIPTLTKAHEHLYKLNRNILDVNIMVPIVKHYEVCEENFKEYNFKDSNPFYSNKASIVFNMIESNGIKVDPALYKHYFDKDTEGYVYTQYNLNTTTTRPSNSFGGVNFSALNKDNGERTCFIPRNDVFIEMDISAYHPTLLANLLGYTFDSDDVHQSFANMYGVDYQKAKEITFKQMYGGIWKEYQDLEFFKRVIAYTDDLWGTLQYQGYIECPISKHIYKRDELKDMNPQKLLSYVLQNLETANNVLILWDILKILRGKNTKLVLYVYDSFLFDVDKSESETMIKILEVFDKYKLQTKIKKGTNYNLKTNSYA